MQEEVLGLFLRLCKDETPLVRRLAAQHLEAWASLLADSPAKQKELIAAFKNFINDDQVRDESLFHSPFRASFVLFSFFFLFPRTLFVYKLSQ